LALISLASLLRRGRAFQFRHPRFDVLDLDCFAAFLALCFMKHSRHTFASDMVRAGVSLPALMQLMGHADIETTLLYIQVTPQDVYLQYARAVAQHIRPVPVNSL
jgi:hypothetical protein